MARPKLSGKHAKAEKKLKLKLKEKKAKKIKKIRRKVKVAVAAPPSEEVATTTTTTTKLARAKPRWGWKTTSARHVRREIKASSTKRAINKTAFRNIVLAICQDLGVEMRWKGMAMRAIQDVLEPLVIKRMAAAYTIVVHGAKKPTLKADHLISVARIRHILGDPTPSNRPNILARA
jgi:histone H3/H4